MDRSKLQSTIALFGISAQNIEKPGHAALTEVYAVDGKYILRARELTSDAIAHLSEEQKMLEKVSEITGIRLPILLSTKNGDYFIKDGDVLWTLYPLIPGDIKYTWYHLDEVGKDVVDTTFKNLKALHSKTKGLLKPLETYKGFSTDVSGRLLDIDDDISEGERKRIQEALKNIREVENTINPDQTVYVHGDYHPGNILLNDEGKITGLIDTDWGRVGHYLEDLSFAIMMFLRNYKEEFTFNRNDLDTYLEPYVFDEEDKGLLYDYLILYTLYDVYVFKTMVNIPDHEKYLKYQKTMLRELCSRI